MRGVGLIKLLLMGIGLLVVLAVGIFALANHGTQDWSCNVQSYPENGSSLMPTQNSTASGGMCASLVAECRHQEGCRVRMLSRQDYFLIGLNNTQIGWYP